MQDGASLGIGLAATGTATEPGPEPGRPIQIAIAGDLHGQWDASDEALLELIAPDALLVVGDLSDGQQRIPARLARLTLPTACILGNHDTGRDPTGHTLRRQLDLLGDRHCGWGLRELRPPGLAVVGAVPPAPVGATTSTMAPMRCSAR